MDIKDSYLHGTVGVVKSISVDADVLSYKLADINGTTIPITLPTATQDKNGLLSSDDKKKLDNMIATQVANNLILQINSGDVEDTDKYTYNGSAAKTLNIQDGSNITLTAGANSLTINASDNKVTQENTTTSDLYRILLSKSANNTKETDSVRKSENLYYDPSTSNLNANYITTRGIRHDYATTLTSLITPHSHGLTYSRFDKTAFENELIDGATNNANGVLWVGTHSPEATNTTLVGYGHMLGFIGSSGLYHKIVSNGSLGGSWNKIAYTTSDISGNAASADKLKYKRKIWGLDFDGTEDVTGSLLYVTSINGDANTHVTITTSGTTGNLYFRYLGDDKSSVVLTADAFGPTSASHQLLDLGKLNRLWKNVYSQVFTGNIDGMYVYQLTNYSKAKPELESFEIVATDSLNTALGKLEYKAGYAYDWIISVTAEDLDEYINKWLEIIDFLNGIDDTTNILDEFVTIKTPLDVTGLKTFLNQVIIKTTASNKTPKLTFNEFYSDSGNPWISEIISDYFGTNICTTENFTHGLYIVLGRSQFDNLIILNSSKSPIARISKEKGHWFDGTLTVTGNTTSAKFITSGGTSSLFVKGDGSLDSNTYATTTSLGNYVTLDTNLTITGNKTFEGSGADLLTIKRTNNSNPTWIRFYKDNNLLGYIGVNDSKAPVFLKDGESPQTIIHSGNYTSYTPILNSSSTHATNASVIYAPFSAGTKGLVLISSGTGAPDWGDIVKTSNYLAILDIRDTTPTPNEVTYKSVTAWFNNLDAPSTNSYWYSGFSVAGWSKDYKVWQLASDSGNDSNENKLYFRGGKGATWEAWREIAFTNGTIATASNGIFYIEGTGSTAGTWLGSHAGISSYYKGLTIAYKIPIAGASTTKLNINSLGAKTCYINTSQLTTHYGVGSVAILVYDGTYFRAADYWDVNSYAYVRQYTTNTIDAEYPLLFRYNTAAPGSSGYVTEYTRYDSAITVNPSTGNITATSFTGILKGGADHLNATEIITSKAFSLSSSSWKDTGYTFTNLSSGTYAVQVTSGSNLVASGIMSIYKNLSDTIGDEIPLHVYGTATWRPYLRTYANKLLISSNDVDAKSRTVTIKIARIL